MKENIRTILCGCFKKKITITQSILVGFLITGSMAMAENNIKPDSSKSFLETIADHEDRLKDVEMTGEENQDAVDRLIDSTAAMDKKLDTTSKISLSNKEKLEKHDGILNGMKNYVNGLTERTEAQENAIEANESKITKANETIADHEDRLKDIEMTGEENQDAVDRLIDSTAAMDKKLDTTSKISLSNKEKLEKHDGILNGMKNYVNGLTERTEAQENAIEANESKITKANEAIADHEDRLKDIEMTGEENQDAVDRLMDNTAAMDKKLTETTSKSLSNEERIEKTETKVSDLDEKMSDAKMDIKSLKGNKADAAETKASLDKLNSEAAAEHKSRLSNEKELAGRVSKTEDKTKKLDAQVSENKDNIEYQRQAIVDVAVIATKNKETLDKTLTKHTDAIEDHENRLDSFAVINNNQDEKDKTHDQMDAQHTKNIDDNKKSIDKNTKTLTNHETRLVQQDARIADNQRAISNLNSRMDNMDSKVNKGMSLMAAMTAIDFQSVDAGEVGIGAGVGHYANCEGVAIGVAYAPTNSFRVNARYSVSTADIHTSAVGVGATYKFKVR
ncbi:MAG: YadA-like family protein [Cetobacterium sp.]|uniref:YadA-like family protein n=1 Tax=Cetobacterium sp. TaxID=2071632 RepID=UPI003F3DAE78